MRSNERGVFMTNRESSYNYVRIDTTQNYFEDLGYTLTKSKVDAF